jgi:HPt (histidine-containing phosphotransfer) domain-containing protein
VASTTQRAFATQPRTGARAVAGLVDGLVFDTEHFSRQTFGDAGLQAEILQLFLVQIADNRKVLASPMTSTSWRFLTHTLKGAASAVGALRLAELSGQWETAGVPEDADARRALLDVFDREAEAFNAAVQEYQG